MINQIIAQRFEILEKVGESPLFIVYKARDKANSRIVAIKAVTPVYAADAKFMEGLRAGMNAAGSLNHPHITHFQEAAAEGETPCFVMEFVRGINLKERIRRIAPFTLSVAIDFACAVAEGLHYAHSVGQAHGDLRPQNIIVSPEGTLKITDFGVMRGVAASSKAQNDTLRSAASYHAPELSMTLPGTPAGDLYALGAVLYEMLTGTPLYSGNTPDEVADQHAFAAIPSPRNINPGVPLAVVGILLKCLQKKPDGRYANAADLLNDLKSVRDALRFGKSLSWSPIDPADMEKMSAGLPRPVAPKPKPEPPPPPPPKPKPEPRPAPQILEPVADVAASSQALPMPTPNRLRAHDNRVSIWLRLPIYGVTLVIIGCMVVMGGIWSSNWVVAKPIPAPKMMNKSIDEARALAEKMNVKLIEHPEYNEKPRNIVYKIDKQENAPIRKGQYINVWFSKGPEYVKVPKVAGLNRDEAEKKIIEAGLKIGKIRTSNSATIPADAVISQSGQVQALHDSYIDLDISDGPKADSIDTTSAETPVPDPETHTWSGHVRLEKDTLGRRMVRIEFDDAAGTHTPVEEMHTGGERIPISFTYIGQTITMRIYYNGEVQKTYDALDPKTIKKEIK